MMTPGLALRVETIAIAAVASLPGDQRGVDGALLVWLNEVRHPALDRFFEVVTWAGSLVVLLPLAIAILVFLACRQRAWDAGLLGLGFGGTTTTTYAVKRLVERPRPDLFPSLVPMPADFSFPSGHTAQITALALCLTIIVCRHHAAIRCGTATALAVLITGLVGFSRLYLQVHYLSDVVAGALLALFWVGGARWVLRRMLPSASR